VRDNGCGITPADTSKFNSFGIRGMIERAGLLDGKLTVSGMSGRGTTVHLSIPFPAGREDSVIVQPGIEP
jgi:signal transduction histidine kinase